MTGDGTLAGEIQRKTAEIDDWPAWAKPYERQTPSNPPVAEHAPAPPGPHENPGGMQSPREHCQ
jgi:hypothetical protein